MENGGWEWGRRTGTGVLFEAGLELKMRCECLTTIIDVNGRMESNVQY